MLTRLLNPLKASHGVGGESLVSKKVFVAAIAAGTVIGIALFLFQVLYNADRFPQQVYIGEVVVGGMNREAAYRAVGSWASGLRNTPVVLTYGDFTYRTDLAGIGGGINSVKLVNDTLDNIRNKYSWWERVFKLNRGSGGTITERVPLTYDNKKLAGVLKSLRSQLESQPQNCRVTVTRNRGLVVIPEKKGKRINIAATLQGVPRYLESTTVIVPIVVDEVLPDLRQEDFNNMGELAAYSTWYNSRNVDRSFNLATAARALNGTIVPPGQEFSFNSVVGPRELSTGYRQALVILGNEFAPGVGGGVCQVVSTLYNACLLAGLEIVERHNHSVAIDYVPVGLDATVNYGVKDFRFKNNSGGPVYIQALTGSSRLTVKVFGPRQFKKRIRLERTVERVVPFQVTEREDPTLPPGKTKVKQAGVPGYTVRSFRIVYDDTGEVVLRQTLARDVYRPLNKLVLVGPPDNSLPETPPVDSGEPAEPTEPPPAPSVENDQPEETH